MTSYSEFVGLRGRRALVTGAAGFIGSHLVDRLVLADLDKILAVDNFFLGSPKNLALAEATDSVEVVRMDAANLAALQDLAEREQVDVLFNLAVVPLPTSLLYPEYVIAQNIGITTTACELARRGLVRKLIHFSSSEVYGTARYTPMNEDHPHDAITPYAASKSGADRVVESYVRTFGIHATTVRPFNNFGPRQNSGSYAGIIPIIIRRVIAGMPIEIHGDGEQTRDFVFVKDTADATVRIAQEDSCLGEVINVASGVETSVNSLVEQVLAALGQPNYPVTHVSERPGDVRRHCADTAKANHLLGFTAYPLASETLRETVDWYMEHES